MSTATTTTSNLHKVANGFSHSSTPYFLTGYGVPSLQNQIGIVSGTGEGDEDDQNGKKLNHKFSSNKQKQQQQQSNSSSSPSRKWFSWLVSSSSSSDSGSQQPLHQAAGVWGLQIVIALLVPIFSVKVAQAMFPIKACSQLDLDSSASDQCFASNRYQENVQYICMLVLSGLFIVLGMWLAMRNKSTLNVSKGFVYGGFISIVFAVFNNYSRMNATSQVMIIGLLLFGFVLLPAFPSVTPDTNNTNNSNVKST